MQVRGAGPDDRPAVEAFLAVRGSVRVARRGELVSALDHASLLAVGDDGIEGVLTYVVTGADCEILTLHAAQKTSGVGTALVSAVRELACDAGCTRLWVLTTNDNLDALRFYQRRGFRLSAVRPGAVDVARAELKPEIPLVGDYGIAIRDEIELDQPL